MKKALPLLTAAVLFAGTVLASDVRSDIYSHENITF